MTHDDMKRLQAAELHEAMPGAGIEIHNGFLISGGWACFPHHSDGMEHSPTGFYIGYGDTENDLRIPVQELDRVIALLQQARAIMAKGGG